MTLAQVRHIKSVGRYRNCAAKGDVTFKKFTLVLGGNGRGKTTLCAILRSLKTQTSEIIIGRKTLGAPTQASVVIGLQSGQALFKNGAWNIPLPGLRIFDAQYVSENIHSGDHVGPDQRRNLCRLILGSRGVVLAREYDSLDRNIDQKNSAIREAKNVIAAYSNGMDTDQFVALPDDHQIDSKIEAKARQLEGVKEIERLRKTAELVRIQLPPVPTQLEVTVQKTFEDLSREAEQIVRNHLAAHGMRETGEDWIAEGLSHLHDEKCPFCAQSIEGLELVGAYKSLFNEKYQQLRTELNRYKANAAKLFADDRIELILTHLAANVSGANVWERYVSLDHLGCIAEEQVKNVLTTFRSALLLLLELKLRAISS